MKIDYLYHATRKSNLDSIMKNGIQTKYYGQVHGRMDYMPPNPAVYLSKFEHSNNLNTRLFSECKDDDSVIILKIDITKLDAQKMFPDDAFFYMLDDLYCCDADEMDSKEKKAFIDDNIDDFMSDFGFSDEIKARTLFKAFLNSDGSMAAYSKIAKKMAVEYLIGQGEIAYLADISPTAILGYENYPIYENKEKALSP